MIKEHFNSAHDLDDTIAFAHAELDHLARRPDFEAAPGPALTREETQNRAARSFQRAAANTNDIGQDLIRNIKENLEADATFTLDDQNVICAAFNNASLRYEQLLSAFLHDMPRRAGLETWLAQYERKAYDLKKKARLAALSAPAPRLAA